MDNCKIPTVTVECGFLSNNQEAKELQEESYQEKIAWGIYFRNYGLFWNIELNMYKLFKKVKNSFKN